MTEEEQWRIIHAARKAGIFKHCDLNLTPRYDKLDRIEFHCLACQGTWLPGLEVFEFLKNQLETND